MPVGHKYTHGEVKTLQTLLQIRCFQALKTDQNNLGDADAAKQDEEMFKQGQADIALFVKKEGWFSVIEDHFYNKANVLTVAMMNMIDKSKNHTPSTWSRKARTSKA